MLALSETFGREDNDIQCPEIPGYLPWPSERKRYEKGGGGLTILYRNNLEAHRWTSEVPESQKYIEKERQWLLINQGHCKCAFLHCYAACVNYQDTTKTYLDWNRDLFCLLTQEAIQLKREGFIILAMGDFNVRIGRVPGMEWNTPDTNDNQPLFMDFVEEVNLTIINTLPVSRGSFTRFMDQGGTTVSRSVLDYGLIDSDYVNYVSNFYIDENLRYRCGSDHALLECDIEFQTRSKIKWNVSEILQYNFSNKSKLDEYKLELGKQCTNTSIEEFAQKSSDDILIHLINCLHNSAKTALGLKSNQKPKGVKLPQNIISIKREKNEITAELTDNDHSPQELTELIDKISKLKSKIKASIGDFSIKKRNRTRIRLLKKDTTRRRFWSFLKNQIKSAGTVSALRKDGQMVFDQADIEEGVLSHFSTIFKGSKIPVQEADINKDQVQGTIDDIDQMINDGDSPIKIDEYESTVCAPFTRVELDSILNSLSVGKSPGFDNISNELLKFSDWNFREYLLTFLNQVLKLGKVPKRLNIGKCMLVFKVRPYQNNFD